MKNNNKNINSNCEYDLTFLAALRARKRHNFMLSLGLLVSSMSILIMIGFFMRQTDLYLIGNVLVVISICIISICLIINLLTTLLSLRTLKKTSRINYETSQKSSDTPSFNDKFNEELEKFNILFSDQIGEELEKFNGQLSSEELKNFTNQILNFADENDEYDDDNLFKEKNVKSIENELEKFKELLASGVITREEYEKKRKKILGI